MYSALIIEDDNTIQAYLKRLMSTKFGFKVFQALNGIEGLKMLEETTPDIILLDNLMPQMNGLEFLRVIKKEDKFKEIPVFVITSSKESDIVGKMLELGVEDYILKPVEPDMINERIQGVINKLRETG